MYVSQLERSFFHIEVRPSFQLLDAHCYTSHFFYGFRYSLSCFCSFTFTKPNCKNLLSKNQRLAYFGELGAVDTEVYGSHKKALEYSIAQMK